MDFFKSVFSDDPDPPGFESDSDNAHLSESQDSPGSDSSPIDHHRDPTGAGGWDLGSLMKTLSSKSESIMETYCHDLQEFGYGLKKEIEIAHGSFESVSHAIDQFGNNVIKGTTQIISQGKDAIILEFDDSDNNKNKNGSNKSLNSKGYNRFDAQVRAIQGDPSTYTQVPEDLDRYNKWKKEFSLEGKSDEMEAFLRENDEMKSVYKRVVPNTVDHDTFWYRYYYKVYKLKEAENVRARLVRRMSREEEELSWDVEDEEEEHVGRDSKVKNGGFDANGVVETKRLLNVEDESKVEERENLLQSKELGNKMDHHQSIRESKVDKDSDVFHEMGDGSKETNEQLGNTGNRNDSAAGSDKERKDGDGKSLTVASQHSRHNGEDLEGGEIEDLSNTEKRKETRSGSPSEVDLRKHLNAAQEEEDLSWDIEDDDEPAKA